MSDQQPKYPHVRVVIPSGGQEGSAPAVLGTVIQAMRSGGIPRPERAAFLEQAQGRNYFHMLRVIREWVSVDQE